MSTARDLKAKVQIYVNAREQRVQARIRANERKIDAFMEKYQAKIETELDIAILKKREDGWICKINDSAFWGTDFDFEHARKYTREKWGISMKECADYGVNIYSALTVDLLEL